MLVFYISTAIETKCVPISIVLHCRNVYILWCNHITLLCLLQIWYLLCEWAAFELLNTMHSTVCVATPLFTEKFLLWCNCTDALKRHNTVSESTFRLLPGCWEKNAVLTYSSFCLMFSLLSVTVVVLKWKMGSTSIIINTSGVSSSY